MGIALYGYMSDSFYITYMGRDIPVNVQGIHLLDAFDWLLEHGDFCDDAERHHTAMIRASWAATRWIESPEKLPFDVGKITFLSDENRLLFKLTFAS